MMAGGAVAIWHDIAAEGLDEFYAWHGEEHMPERVSIPGFLAGRRYGAIEAELGFFNLYETASPAVVAGPEYKARLDNPTPRTLSTVRHFRNVARSLCRIASRTSRAELGRAEGGHCATLRYDVELAAEIGDLAVFVQAVIPGLATLPGIAGTLLLAADRAASGYVNAEQRARGSANLVPPIALIVEGWGDEAAFVTALKDALSQARLDAAGLSGESRLDFFRHQLTITAGR